MVSSAVFVPTIEGRGCVLDFVLVAGGGGIEVSKVGGHVGFKEILRNAAGDGAGPPGECNSSLSDLLALFGLFVTKWRLVIDGSVTGLFEELADVIGQSAADDSPVLLLVAFL